MDDARRLVTSLSGRILWSTLIILTSTTGLQADHNKLLQLEFKRGISKHLACDRGGYCYVLQPSPEREGGPGFTLKVSQKPHPESMSDFRTTVATPDLPEAAGTSFFSVGLAVDARDQLHLICTTDRGHTVYSVVDARLLRTGRSGAKWSNPVNRQEEVLALAAASFLLR